MPAKKRPAVAEEEEDDDTRQRKSRVGFKDAGRLAAALGPWVNHRSFTSYTTDRDMKATNKKKLSSQPSARFRTCFLM